MNVLAQQVTPVPCDPNNVLETFANGPISIQGIGSVVTITFTSVRQRNVANATPAAQDFSAVVVSRMALPVEVAVQLKELLNRTLLQQGTISAGSSQKQ